MSTVLHWNGEELPEELRALPTGRYVIVAIDEAPDLTAEQEAGLDQALASVRAGRGVSPAEARERLTAALRR